MNINKLLNSKKLIAMHFTSASLMAQVVIPVNIDAPRPARDAVQKIEQLSRSGINYEDLTYNFADDLQDVTGSVLTAEQRAAKPDVRIIVPKSGRFSATIPAEPMTNTLIGDVPISNALNTVLSAAHAAKSVPGEFRVDLHSGHFFVEPVRGHRADGTEEAVQPILSRIVTTDEQVATGRSLIEGVLQQVSKSAGVKIVLGMIPVAQLYGNKVTVKAGTEPAKYALSRILAAVFTNSKGDPIPVSYQMLFEPTGRFYVFNVHTIDSVVITKEEPASVAPPNPGRAHKTP